MSIPEAIKLKKVSNLLEILFQGIAYHLPAEYLRVYSPSAEVQGHGKPILQYGKKHVKLLKAEVAGHYALKLTFDDGHDSGFYSWDYLYTLATQQQSLWSEYLKQLNEHAKSRDPTETVIHIIAPKK